MRVEIASEILKGHTEVTCAIPQACLGTECPKEGPAEADSEGKVSLTKGAYKADRWLEGDWEKSRGTGGGGAGGGYGQGQTLGPGTRLSSRFLSGSIASKPCT